MCGIFFKKKKAPRFFAEPLLLFIVAAESVGEDELHLSRFGGINNLNVTVALHAGTGGKQLTDDDVFLESEQRINLALDCGIGENPCGLLE